MAKSISQLQNEALSFLETKGQGREGFDDVTKLPAITQLLVLSAANFIIKVQENLKNSGKIDTGLLSSSIESGDVIESGGKVEISVGYPANSKAAKYYDFVNKGVKGLRSGEPSDSPYSFRKETAGGAMVEALARWYRRNGASNRNETQKKNLSSVQRKRKKLSKMINADQKVKSLAYATAISIKRKGLKKTGFFDNAVKTSFGQEFVQAIAKIAGKEIAVNIR